MLLYFLQVLISDIISLEKFLTNKPFQYPNFLLKNLNIFVNLIILHRILLLIYCIEQILLALLNLPNLLQYFIHFPFKHFVRIFVFCGLNTKWLTWQNFELLWK